MSISRALHLIAGVDSETLSKCPKTDRLWAAHLGFSLLLSFFVVAAITYHATSYVIENSAMRLAASLVVALTVFMFDRALYQADWFLQTPLDKSEWNATRFIRIIFRLAISVCLSFALAIFLELAIFSDTITGQLQDDFRSANAHLFDKAADFEALLDRQIEERRAALREAENLVIELNSAGAPAQLQELETSLAAIIQERSYFEEDRNAELFGRRTRPEQTGIAGRGPAYHFAEAQIVRLKEQERDLRESIASLRDRDFTARENASHATDRIRAEVETLIASGTATAAEFRRSLVEGSLEYQRQKNDPLARMGAYSRLKQDPNEGPTIVLFSWLIRLFVSFLEVVPVAAKMLFCPPSVYGSIIKAEVVRQRRQAERILDFGDSARSEVPSDRTFNPNLYQSIAAVVEKKARRIPEVFVERRDLGTPSATT